jgi:hypothetical protein
LRIAQQVRSSNYNTIIRTFNARQASIPLEDRLSAMTMYRILDGVKMKQRPLLTCVDAAVAAVSNAMIELERTIEMLSVEIGNDDFAKETIKQINMCRRYLSSEYMTHISVCKECFVCLKK